MVQPNSWREWDYKCLWYDVVELGQTLNLFTPPIETHAKTPTLDQSLFIPDFLFLVQAGIVISLGLAVVGAVLMLLTAALPLPDFIERWISSLAIFVVELPPSAIALILTAGLILMWLWWRRRKN